MQAYHIHDILDGVKSEKRGNSNIVILHPKYVYRMLLNLAQDKNLSALCKCPRTLECLMINVLPVPPNSIRLLSNPQQQNHAMNIVYNKAVTANTAMKEKVKWTDDLFIEESDNTQNMVQILELLTVACRVAMSRDTSKNAQPTTK